LVSKVTYEPKKIGYTAAEIALQTGSGAACALCVAGVVGVLGGVFKTPVPSSYLLAIEAACGGACAAYFASMDGCWFVRCEQDATTKSVTYGGSGC
jgi:hypothetical protein